MQGVDWLFPVLLFAALVLSAVMTLFQQRRYTTEINVAAQASSGASDALVSGRGRGLLRGAVVVLIINREARTITHARAMVGSTVFARFRPAPFLLGPLNGAEERARGKQLKKAVNAALAQVPAEQKSSASTEEKVARARRARQASQAARGKKDSGTSPVGVGH